MKTLNHANKIPHIYKGVKQVLLTLLILCASIPLLATDVEYKSHQFDASGNLLVDIRVDLTNGGCQNFLGFCTYTFEGNLRIKQGLSNIILPQPFTITRTVAFQSTGTNTTETLIIPASALTPLVVGNQYDIAIELTFSVIPIQPPGSYSVFSPCFVGSVDTSAPEIFPPAGGSSCEIMVDCFTYGPAANSFTWQQGQSFMCSLNPFQCWVVYNLNGHFTAPNVSPTVTYTWFVDGVQVGTGLNFTYTFPNCGTYEVELQIGAPGSNCPIVITQDITLAFSPFCSVGEPDPPCCGTERTGVMGSEEIMVQLSPNPIKSGEQAILEYFSLHQEVSTLRIFDLQGRTVFEQHLGSMKKGTNLVKLSLPKVPSGIYILKIASEHAQGQQKLIIE